MGKAAAKAVEYTARFYYHTFLRFCLQLPLLLVLGILAGLVTRRLGVSMGVHLLLGHEDPWKQAAGGLFLGFVAGECLLLGFVFEQRQWRGPDAPARVRARDFLLYSLMLTISFILTFLFFEVVFESVKLLVRHRLYRPIQNPNSLAHRDETPWTAFYGGTLVALACVLGVVKLAGLGRVSGAIEGWNRKIGQRVDYLRQKGLMRRGAEVSTRLVQAFLLPLALAVLVNAAFWACRGTRFAYSPLVTCMYFVYMILALYGLLYYMHPRLVPAVVLALLLCLTIGGLPTHKYRLPGMNSMYNKNMTASYNYKVYNDEENNIDPKTQPPRRPKDESGLLQVGDVKFRTDEDRRAGRRVPLVVIVVSGGGLRSAAWTYSILQRLEKEFRDLEPGLVNFPRHVRVISGASGGMLGAAYYTATLPEPRVMEAGWADGSRERELSIQYEYLTRDCLTSIVDCMLLSDLPAIFSPFPQLNDRGLELEKAWAAHMGHVLSVPLSSLKAKEAAGWCPSLVFSPMMIEDGRRLLISNLDLDPVVRNAGNELAAKRITYSREAVEFYKTFAERPGGPMLRLSTAIRLSASFPFFSPSVTLPTWPRRRVVDAGYYDNYGVSVAASYLFSQSQREWFNKNASGILLVQIRDGISEKARIMSEPPSDEKTPPPSQIQLALEEFTSPVEGVLNARVSTASYRNDGMLELLSQFFLEKDSDNPFHFTTVTFEYPFEASLSWYLTRQERTDIRLAAGVPIPEPLLGGTNVKLTPAQQEASRAIDERIKGMKSWWKDRQRDEEARLKEKPSTPPK